MRIGVAASQSTDAAAITTARAERQRRKTPLVVVRRRGRPARSLPVGAGLPLPFGGLPFQNPKWKP